MRWTTSRVGRFTATFFSSAFFQGVAFSLWFRRRVPRSNDSFLSSQKKGLGSPQDTDPFSASCEPAGARAYAFPSTQGIGFPAAMGPRERTSSAALRVDDLQTSSPAFLTWSSSSLIHPVNRPCEGELWVFPPVSIRSRFRGPPKPASPKNVDLPLPFSRASGTLGQCSGFAEHFFSLGLIVLVRRPY